jgi:Tfp pilus assembly protein PilO
MSPAASKPSRRNNSWFVTIPVVAASLGFWLWIYRPAQNELCEMRAELELKQQAAADAAMLPEKIRRMRQDLEETRRFVAAWRQTAAKQKLPHVFGEISHLVASSGAKSTRFQPESAVGYKSIERLPVTLTCQGSFAQVFDLLCKLEQLPHSLWIDELHVQQIGKNEGAVSCELRLGIFTGKSIPAESPD